MKEEREGGGSLRTGKIYWYSILCVCIIIYTQYNFYYLRERIGRTRRGTRREIIRKQYFICITVVQHQWLLKRGETQVAK